MSYKSALVKMAIKMTPDAMVKWVANIILKGIAKLTEFNFDLETRKVYVQTILYGEEQTIEVWLEDFALIKEDGCYKFIIQNATSDRPWLQNLMSHITGKAWKIPPIPQLAPYLELVAELLSPRNEEAENE